MAKICGVFCLLTSSVRYFVLASLFASLLFDAAVAAPWPRESGRLFLESRLDYFRAETAQEGVFERVDATTYVEYGLNSKTMIGGKIVYGSSWLNDGSVQLAATGFTEIDVFAQRTIHRRRNDILSLRLGATRPARRETGVRARLAADNWDGEIRTLYGRNLRLKPIKIFTTTEVAYRRRFGDAADQLRIDGTIGFEPNKNWLALVELQSTVSLRNAAPNGADFDVLKLQPSIIRRVSQRWSVRAGGIFELASRNLTTGNGAFLALWSEF